MLGLSGEIVCMDKDPRGIVQTHGSVGEMRELYIRFWRRVVKRILFINLGIVINVHVGPASEWILSEDVGESLVSLI